MFYVLQRLTVDWHDIYTEFLLDNIHANADLFITQVSDKAFFLCKTQKGIKNATNYKKTKRKEQVLTTSACLTSDIP